MRLDELALYHGWLVFVRLSAMLLAAPFSQGLVPVQIRILWSALLALGLTPVLGPSLPDLPASLPEMASDLAYAAAIGLLIGFVFRLLADAFSVAGAFVDLNMGLAMSQVFNPTLGSSTTVVGRFYFTLAIVLLFLLDGHHVMIEAFVGTFRIGESWPVGAPAEVVGAFARAVGQCCLLGLQMAAPVAGVCVVIDAATGVVNKAVPQMHGYLVTLPAKIAVGLGVMALSLPLLAVGVRTGVEHAVRALERLLGG